MDHAHFFVSYIPMDTWVDVQTRAQRERWPLQAFCVQLLKDYADGALTPTTQAPTESTAARILRYDPRTPCLTIRREAGHSFMARSPSLHEARRTRRVRRFDT